MTLAVPLDNTIRHAETLLDLLVDKGPLTSAECCALLGWSKGRFGAALHYARTELCPGFGFSIPHPTPTNGWQYQVTTDWAPVEAGAAYSLGLVESRLVPIARDVAIVKPHLERGSREWRRGEVFVEKVRSILSARSRRSTVTKGKYAARR